MNNGLLPNTCEELKRACLKRLGEPEKPIAKPDLHFISSNLVSNKSLYNFIRHPVPDLDQFSLQPECEEQCVCLFEGGETKALELFAKRLDYEREAFQKGETNPNLSKPIMFTKEVSLSPYLRHGCLSVRKFYWELNKAYLKVSTTSLLKS